MTVTNPNPDNPTPLQAAERYAALGWRVIPIAPGTRYPAGLKQWQDAATTDLDTIRAWWTGLYRGHGIGIATGPTTGAWAIDIDIKDGKQGRQSFEALEHEHAPLPATPTTITGTGGLHLYFQWDPEHPITNWQENAANSGSPLGPGIDIRGDRGQVVAWPTVHPDTGTLYRWADGRDPWTIPVAQAPAWLYERLGRDRERATPPVPAPTPQRPEGNRAAIGDRTPESAADHIRATNNFEQVLTTEGWTYHHTQGPDTYWVRPGKNPRQGHSGVLHNDGDGPLVVFTTEIPAALASCGQPTVDGTGVSFTVFDFLAGTRHNGNKSALARLERETLNRDRAVGIPTPTRGNEGAVEHANEEEEEHNRHRRALLTEAGLADIPQPEPLAPGWLHRHNLAAIIGPPKTGKTIVAIDLSMAIATGSPWLGGPTIAGNVIYCLGEGVAGLGRRIHAWRTHHHNTTPAQLHILPHTPQLGNGADVYDFLDAIGPHNPDLIVIDTLARAAVGVEENSAMEMGRVIAEADRIKEATGACVLLIHHTGKDTARGSRGSNALDGAVDTMIEVRGDIKALTLHNTLQKDAAAAEDRQFRAETVGDSIVLVPTLELAAASERVHEVLEALVAIDVGATTSTAWVAECAERGISESTMHRAKKWLVDNSQIVNVGSDARPLWTAGTTDGGAGI